MTSTPQPLLVLGTSRFAEEIANIANDSGFVVAGFVENLDPARQNETKDGLPIYWIDDIRGLIETHLVVCGLGTTHRKKIVEHALSLDARFATIVHPKSHVSSLAELGEGAVVCPGAVIGAYSRIQEYVLIGSGAVIGHDTTVAPYSSIMAGVRIAGHVKVGASVWVGMGALILNQMEVGDNSIVGAGAVVTKSLPDRVLAVGVPARITRRHIEGK